MDHDNEILRAKWLVSALIVLCVCCCINFSEISYLLFGQDATGTVTNVYETKVGRRRFGFGGRTRLAVDYRFTEKDGTARTGSDTMSLDSNYKPGGAVAIRYTAGKEGNSRIAGHVNWVSLSIMGLALLSLLFFGVKLVLEANAAYKERPRKRSAEF